MDRLAVELHRLSIFDDDDVIVVEASLSRNLGVLDELPVLAVHRDEVAGPNRVEHLA
jgi:hypothetical protein